MKINYKELAESTVSKAIKKGATEAQVSISDGTKFSVDIREGDVEQLISAGSTSLSLKLIIDKKVVTASTSDLSSGTLDTLLDNSIAKAKFLSADEFSSLAELEKFNFDIESLKLYDQTAESIAPEKKIKMAIELEKMCLADKKIKRSSGAGFSNYSGTSFLANSKGFSANYRRSSSNIGIGLQAGSDENLYEDGYSDSSRSFNDLMSIEDIAKKAIYLTTRLIDARKIKTQNVPIILEPEMASGMLMGFLVECLYGSNIYMQRSFLAGKLGEKIANEHLTMIDNPLIPGAPGSVPYDGDGIPARRLSIIEKGVLKNYFLNNYAAKKLSMSPTGPAPTNLSIVPGRNSKEDIIKSVDKGLLLCSTIGQGTVATSGDISKGAYGIWIEKGELTYPVSEVTISGNLGKMLTDIEMIGNDPDTRRAFSSPTLKIREMTISGT